MEKHRLPRHQTLPAVCQALTVVRFILLLEGMSGPYPVSEILRLAHALDQAGINVQPILPPAVEGNQSRLRFFVSAQHTEKDITTTVRAIAESMTPPA